MKREEPRLSCDRATTVARGGECLCRYDGMRKTSKTSCGRTRGLVFAPGAGCRKVKIDNKPRGNTDDGAAGTESCRIKINGICLK